jgi:hypothetical protein
MSENEKEGILNDLMQYSLKKLWSLRLLIMVGRFLLSEKIWFFLFLILNYFILFISGDLSISTIIFTGTVLHFLYWILFFNAIFNRKEHKELKEEFFEIYYIIDIVIKEKK